MSEIRYVQLESPIGKLTLLADEDSIVRLDMGPTRINDSWQEGGATLKDATRQLRAYFDGKLRDFELPLSPRGTEFQRRVWRQLCKIPFGQAISYGQLASRCANPRASRAVGSANGRNPIGIIIPCHRVIASDGKLGGYSAGLDRKRWLLRHEGVAVAD
ncbi:MAG: methylated-DNA--[protein]-cysteine S-methyltransferase [Phycisphaerae bacterium]